jgi:hypothetical protein
MLADGIHYFHILPHRSGAAQGITFNDRSGFLFVDLNANDSDDKSYNPNGDQDGENPDDGHDGDQDNELLDKDVDNVPIQRVNEENENMNDTKE